MAELYIGLMSGTSADGIDAALVEFTDREVIFRGGVSQPFSSKVQHSIHQLADSQTCTLEQLGTLDAELGIAFADCAQKLLSELQINPSQVKAIGSHGQTVRHRPPRLSESGFTLQIGDPNLIAERTGITTVADFRRRDMAAGGQGAPLAPGFHHWALHSDKASRAVVNIGGMSNLTWLPKSGTVLGYDLGPGNVLMDCWTQKHLGKNFDLDGQWASTGRVKEELLTQLLQHPFLALPPPKSTGREAFNLAWLESILSAHSSVQAQDIQATLCEFTAKVISNQCLDLTCSELYICGGGARNLQLMSRIQSLLPAWQVQATDKLGVDSQWVEAIAFAWLARQTLANKPGNLSTVTGASNPVVLGAVYY